MHASQFGPNRKILDFVRTDESFKLQHATYSILITQQKIDYRDIMIFL